MSAETVMAPRSVAVQLAAPHLCRVASRTVVWVGGVRVDGDQMSVPGRCIDAEHLDDARAHAAAVLAAVALIEERIGAPTWP